MSKYFYLMAPDIDAFFYSESDIEDGRLCPSCSSRLVDFAAFFPRELRASKLRKDWGYTYDNQLVFSDRARSTLGAWGVGCTILPLDQRGRLFTAVFHDVFEFDPQFSGTRYLDSCGVCGNFGSIVGVTPVGIGGAAALKKPLYRSDIEFGSGAPKTPIVIVSDPFREFLEAHFPELGFRSASIVKH